MTWILHNPSFQGGNCPHTSISYWSGFEMFPWLNAAMPQCSGRTQVIFFLPACDGFKHLAVLRGCGVLYHKLHPCHELTHPRGGLEVMICSVLQECDVVLMFPSGAQDFTLMWLLSRLRAGTPGLVVHVRHHASSDSYGFYLTAPFTV